MTQPDYFKSFFGGTVKKAETEAAPAAQGVIENPAPAADTNNPPESQGSMLLPLGLLGGAGLGAMFAGRDEYGRKKYLKGSLIGAGLGGAAGAFLNYLANLPVEEEASGAAQ